MNKFLIVSLTLLFISTFVSAQSDKRKASFNLNKSSLAISGFDPVSYFTKSTAVKGNKQYALLHEGVQYYFSSPGNKELFRSNPAQYEPQYGGWCAYAMGANGEKVEIDPETFKIVDGKLYLFYNRVFNNTLTSWNKDEVRLKANADVNWQKYFR